MINIILAQHEEIYIKTALDTYKDLPKYAVKKLNKTLGQIIAQEAMDNIEGNNQERW